MTKLHDLTVPYLWNLCLNKNIKHLFFTFFTLIVDFFVLVRRCTSEEGSTCPATRKTHSDWRTTTPSRCLTRLTLSTCVIIIEGVFVIQEDFSIFSLIQRNGWDRVKAWGGWTSGREHAGRISFIIFSPTVITTCVVFSTSPCFQFF